MFDVVFLAWRSIVHYRVKTLVMAGSIAVILFLPAALNLLVQRGGAQLRSRADSTPLLIGAKGSPLELTLRSLYFDAEIPEPTKYREFQRVRDGSLADAIPLHVQYRTRQSPIVGTSLDYFRFRGLQVRQGRRFGMLGECVVGAEAARLANLQPGDSVMSAAENVFDLAGVYPLKMKVVGVLAPSGTADDKAVFVDIKTVWVIAGLGHGHDSLKNAAVGRDGVLRRDNSHIVTDASVMQFNEITRDNAASFHFHGDRGDFPLTAVIAVPHDAKSATLLRGRYLGENELVQVVNPSETIAKLLDVVLTVRRYLLAAILLLATATIAVLVLVFALSIQLRRREVETMRKIGASPRRIAAAFGAEALFVFALGSVLAGGLLLSMLLVADRAGPLLVRFI